MAERKATFINGIDVDAPIIENTFIPNHRQDTISLTSLYLSLTHGACDRENLPEHVSALLATVEPGLRIMSERTQTRNKQPNRVPYMSDKITEQERDQYAYTAVPKFKDPWYPHKDRMLSLNQIFLFIRHGFSIDKLPADTRSAYEEALPYLERRFHRE